MYALDNDTLSLFLRRHPQVTARILAVPPYDLWLPAIAAEEQLRGRLAFLASLNPNHPADSTKIPQAYDLLVRTLRQLENFQILPYTPEAEALYQSWPSAIKRFGTRDCRIAAIAVTNGFTVVTRNTAHFASIPGLTAEDWSVE